MSRRFKIMMWVAGLFSALLALMILALAALPYLVDLQPIKTRIQKTLSGRLDGEVRFNRIDVSLLASRVSVSNVRLRTSGFNAVSDQVRIDFNVLSLLRGAPKIDGVVFTDPDVSMPFPEPAQTAKELPQVYDERPLQGLRKRLLNLFSRFQTGFPVAALTIKAGRIRLTRDEKPLYHIQNLDGQVSLPAERIRIDLTCTSELWESMTFSGGIDADAGDAHGKLTVNGLQIEALKGSRSLWEALKNIEQARVSLALDFESKDLTSIEGQLQGTAVSENMPALLEISAGKWRYDRKGLMLKNFKVRAGNSYFEAFQAHLGRKKTEKLKIESGKARFDLSRTLPWAAWLSQIKGIRDITAAYPDLKGIFSFSNLNVQGVLRQPRDWEFEGKATLRDLAVETANLPAPLELERTTLDGNRKGIAIEVRNLTFLNSSLSLSGNIRHPLTETAAVDLSVRGYLGLKAIQWLTGRFDWPGQMTAGRGGIGIDELNLKGPLSKPKKLFYKGRGSAQNLVLKARFLPDAVTLAKGDFVIDPRVLSLKSVQVKLFDASATVSGSVKDYRHGVSSVDLNFNGAVGERAAGWLQDKKLLPAWVHIAAPVSVRTGSLVWGRDLDTTVVVDLNMENGIEAVIELVKAPQKLTIKKLKLKDSASQASMALTLVGDSLDLKFNGHLSGATLQNLIKAGAHPDGWIRGDFTMQVPLGRPVQTRMQGTLQAGGFSYAQGLPAPLQLRRLSVQAQTDNLRIEFADFAWRETEIQLSGDVALFPPKVVVDLSLLSTGLDWEEINRILPEPSRENEASQAVARVASEGPAGPIRIFGDIVLEGKVVLQSDSFTYGNYTWKPFHLSLDLEDRRMGVQLSQSSLCSIQTQATARIFPEPAQIEAGLEAHGRSLAPALDCLLESRLMTGAFDLSGQIKTRGHPENFLDNLQGAFRFSAEDGRIFKYGLLGKILAVVNITEILKGQAPDLQGEGFGYKSARAAGVIENGTLTLTEAYVNGQSLDLAFAGNLVIPKRQIDLTVLVTPLKTIDSIIERIPIVRHIVGKNFMAIPVRVEGSLSDPAVTPLPASAVAKGLLGILERTLKLPVKVIQPFSLSPSG